MKKLVVASLITALTIQPVYSFTKDVAILGLGVVSGIKGIQLISESREEVKQWHKSREYLQYNRDLDSIDWLEAYQKRAHDKVNTDTKMMVGLSLVTLSGLTFYFYYRFKIKPRLDVSKDKLSVSMSLNF